MSDYYSIQEVGGTELAKHYPDRGLISESPWYKAILIAGTKAGGWRRWFRKLERFIATVSGNKEGLRVFVPLDQYAVFIPWSEITMTAERSSPATAVHVQTAAVPTVELTFHIDDEAADALFLPIMKPLPTRYPPRRLHWPYPWALGALLAVAVVAAVSLAHLHLSANTIFIANVATATALALLWVVCRPIFEEHR
jgi:hypothetical protein